LVFRTTGKTDAEGIWVWGNKDNISELLATAESAASPSIVKGQGKGKVHPRTGHEGPEGE